MNNLVELTGLVNFVVPMHEAEGEFSLIALTVDDESMTVMASGESRVEVEMADIGPGDQLSLQGRLNLEQTELYGQSVLLPTIEMQSLVAVERIQLDKVA